MNTFTNDNLVTYQQLESGEWLLYFTLFDDEIAVQITEPTFHESAGDLIIHKEKGRGVAYRIILDAVTLSQIQEKERWVSYREPRTMKLAGIYINAYDSNFELFRVSQDDGRLLQGELRPYKNLPDSQRKHVRETSKKIKSKKRADRKK